MFLLFVVVRLFNVYREISLCTPLNYRSQIKAHFGVDVGSELSGMSTYIGGEASSLDISEVVNTALATADVENPEIGRAHV